MAFLSSAIGGQKGQSLNLYIKAYNQTKEGVESAKQTIRELRTEIAYLQAQEEKYRTSGHHSAAQLANVTDRLTKAKEELSHQEKLLGGQIAHGTDVVNKAEESYDRLVGTMGSLYSAAKQLAIAVALPIAAGEAVAVKNAAWAIEMENLFRVTTGNMTEAGWKWTQEFEKQVGISQTRARQMVGTFHIMLTSMGQMEEKAMGMSKSLVKLGYDIASFYNVDVDVAFEKLQSGIVGLPRGLKTLGIVVTEEMTKQWALNNALIKTGETLTEQQKVWARYNVIMQQTRKAQGDLYRTMTSPQNQMRILKERAYELSIAFGKSIMPAFQAVMNAAIKLVKILQGMPQDLKAFLMTSGAVVVALILMSVTFLKTAVTITTWSKTLKEATKTAVLFGKIAKGLSVIGIILTALTIALTLIAPLLKSSSKSSDEYKKSIEELNKKLKDNLLTEEERFKIYKQRWDLEQKVAKATTRETVQARWGAPSATGGSGQFGGMITGYGAEPAAMNEWIRIANQMGLIASKMEDARFKLGQEFLKMVERGGDELAKITAERNRILAILSDPGKLKEYTSTYNITIEELKKEFDLINARFLGLRKGREALQWALEQKGFPLPVESIQAEIERMKREDPTALENIRLELMRYVDTLKDEYAATLQAQEAQVKLNAAVADLNKAAGWKTVDAIKEEYAALQEAIALAYNEARAGGLSEIQANKIITEKFGERVKKFVEENKYLYEIHEKALGKIPEWVIMMAEAYDVMTESVKGVKKEVNQTVKDFEKLADTMDKLITELTDMQIASDQFIQGMRNDMARAARDMADALDAGVFKKFDEMKKHTLTPKAELLNPMEAEVEASRRAWDEMKKELEEAKKDYEDYYEDRMTQINEYYANEEVKFRALVDMRKAEVKVAEVTYTTIAEMRNAAEKGDVAAIERLGGAVDAAFADITETGLAVLAGGKNDAVRVLNEWKTSITPKVEEIDAKIAEIAGLKSVDEARIRSTFTTINGYVVKIGARVADVLKRGIRAIPDLLSFVASEFEGFFGDVSEGFGVTLPAAIASFGEALRDIIEFGEKLKDQGKTYESFGQMLNAISPENIAKLSAALGGLVSGKKNNLGGLFSGIFQTATTLIPGIGKLLGPTLSKVAGGLIGFVGGLFGRKSAAEKEADRVKKLIPIITKDMAKFGKITSETAEAIAKSMKTLSEHAAVSKHFAQVIEDVGVNQNNVNALWNRAAEIFTDLKNKALPVEDAVEAIGESFTKLLEGAKKLGTEGSNAMVAFIKKAQQSGQKIQEVIDYVNDQLGVSEEGLIGAAKAIEMMAFGTAKGLEELMEEKAKIEEELTDRLLRGYARRLKQKELNAVMEKIRASGAGFADDLVRIGNIAVATFSEMLKNGVSLRDAFASLGPTLDLLINRMDLYGTAGSEAIDELLKIRRFQTANEELFDAIQGNLAAMEALFNVGGLNQDLFSDMQEQMIDYYNQLTDTTQENYLTQEEAFAILGPTMMKILQISRERRWAINDETEALINQARTEGQIRSEQVSLVDAILGGFGKLIQVITGRMPDAFRRAAESLDGYAAEQNRTEREMEERNRERTREYTGAMEDAGRCNARVTGDIASGWREVNDAITDATNAAEAFSTAGTRSRPTIINRNENDVIHGQTGGTWKVSGSSQLFRAHQGETVTIYKPEHPPAVFAASTPAPTPIINTFSFEIHAVDDQGVEKLFQRKLIPLLEKYTKSEHLLIHPNAVRRY